MIICRILYRKGTLYITNHPGRVYRDTNRIVFSHKDCPSEALFEGLKVGRLGQFNQTTLCRRDQSTATYILFVKAEDYDEKTERWFLDRILRRFLAIKKDVHQRFCKHVH